MIKQIESEKGAWLYYFYISIQAINAKVLLRTAVVAAMAMAAAGLFVLVHRSAL